MCLFAGREKEGGYEPSLMFKLFRPRTSGNTINGLGETKQRLPTPVYHRMKWHPWWLNQLTFYVKSGRDEVAGQSIDTTFKLKKAQAKVIDQLGKRLEKAPEDWTRAVRDRSEGTPKCDIIGIAKNHKELYFDWNFKKENHFPKYVIVLLRHMDYGEMEQNLQEQVWQDLPVKQRKWLRPGRETMGVYKLLHEAADDLASWIRSQGYHAEGLGGALGSKTNMLRAAIEAGLGELGKHGSLLNDTYGSSLRLSVVLTDMPLVPDKERDFGADKFCESCQLCTTSCLPQAISDHRKLVRGVEKWYVNFDKCIPYFNDANGCSICISSCPWSRPGVAPNLAKKMLRKKAKDADVT